MAYQWSLTTQQRFEMMFRKSREMAEMLERRGYRKPFEIIEILFVKRHLALDDLTSVTFNLLGAVQQAAPVVGEGQAPYQTGEA